MSESPEEREVMEAARAQVKRDREALGLPLAQPVPWLVAVPAVPPGMLLVLPERRPGEAEAAWLKRCVLLRDSGEGQR